MTSREGEAGTGSGHVPVLCREVVDWLAPERGMSLVDCTLGGGGHAQALLAAVGGELDYLGIDRDREALARAGRRLAPFAGRVRFFHSPFSRVRQVVEEAGLTRVDRVLMDLGLSSFALDDPDRGFGFMAPGRLDMRMDRSEGEDAAALLARISQEELTRILADYGEERHARAVAWAIVQARRRTPIETTTGLAEIVARAVPRSPRHRIHPATRTFQALRIAVNRELDQLREGLEAVAAVLGPAGRVAVISFHSLEDRVVKRFFKERFHPLTRKVVRPSPEEVGRNRRARSARLRVAVAGEEA